MTGDRTLRVGSICSGYGGLDLGSDGRDWWQRRVARRARPGIPISRNEQLKALGNGCVPQQVALALDLLDPEADIDRLAADIPTPVHARGLAHA